MTKKYEVIIVLDPDLDDQGVKQQIAKIKDLISAHQGSVEREEVLGRQPLSYPIKKKTYGTYVLLVLSAEGTFVAGFNRQTRIADEVLRAMIVSKDKFAPDFIARAERPERTHGGPAFGRDDDTGFAGDEGPGTFN